MDIQNRNAEYELVRQVRESCNKVNSRLSDKTQADYIKKYQRIQTTGKLPEQHNTKRAYYAYRAALLYGTAQTARNALRARDKAVCGSEAWKNAIDALEKCAAVFSRYPPDPKREHHLTGSGSFTWEAVKQHKIKTNTGWSATVASKKRILYKLNQRPDWASRLFEAVTEKHKAATAISILTGARPSEIAQGVMLSLAQKNNKPYLVIRIKGSKITDNSGQPERLLYVSMDGPEATFLGGLVQGRQSLITTNPANLCAAIIKAGRKAFPTLQETVTPYVFRHHLASQMKAVGLPPDVIAQTLGHRASESQQAYGYAVSAGGSALKLAAVTATHAVRDTYRDPRSHVNLGSIPELHL